MHNFLQNKGREVPEQGVTANPAVSSTTAVTQQLRNSFKLPPTPQITFKLQANPTGIKAAKFLLPHLSIPQAQPSCPVLPTELPEGPQNHSNTFICRELMSRGSLLLSLHPLRITNPISHTLSYNPPCVLPCSSMQGWPHPCHRGDQQWVRTHR